MAEATVARTAVPAAIRRGLLDFLEDRCGVTFLLELDDGLACPRCQRPLLEGVLVQQISPTPGAPHLVYVWRCVLCPPPPRFVDLVAA